MEDLKSVGEFLRARIEKFEYTPQVSEYGVVRSCTDDIVQIDGLSHSRYGELLEFGNSEFGLALDLRSDGVGAVLMSKDRSVTPGTVVRGTGTVAKIPVGAELLGRIIDPIGRPLDDVPLECDEYRAIESPAPTIMQRSPVSRSLETGILSLDSMIPIGRGQRELIIGDRQTGKTSIALAAIKNQTAGDVICVYCAIGQKAASVAQAVRKLRDADALKNTVVVVAAADDCAAMQYLSPYSACAIAEHFMYEGRDVLVVYDDLSKHAVAYRSMSLLLRRPSGREAYPGDVFYLHSRLLERSAKLGDELGGGSMTALPIIETMSGDISAYIPTNVISITDGQIYLETDLFNAGERPAVNVGLSVSRVGRSAQSKAMKEVSGDLRLELAQYRDTAVFAQFGADIDETTVRLLSNGERLTELLKQGQDEVLSLAEQVALLLAYKDGRFSGLPVSEVRAAKCGLIERLRMSASGTMHSINTSGELGDTDRTVLTDALGDFFRELEDAKQK